MNEPKPIFAIGLSGNGTVEDINRVSFYLQKKLTDYHVIVYQTGSSETKLNCFYYKDIIELNETDLENMLKSRQPY